MSVILIAQFVTVLLIFMRIFAAYLSSPIFGHKSIPVLAQVGLAFVVAYMIFMAGHMKTVEGNITLWFIFINGVKEVLTGLVIGYSLHLVFWGISYAGTLIGFDMGLSMAEVLNPTEEISNNVIGELIYIAAILVFFLINGHHYFIQALASSFDLIAIGHFGITDSVFNLLVKYTGGVFLIAVKIAAPIMVSFFLVHLAEGLVARVIPQMQVFFVTQPLKIALGLSLLIALVPVYVYVIKGLLHNYEDSLYQLIKAMGS